MEISMFDKWEINTSILIFSVRSVNIAPDDEYLAYNNHIYIFSQAFWNTLFSANIRSSFDILWPNVF